MARCYFCNKPVNTKHQRQFRCPHCSSLNKYDPVTGEIHVDEPAMYDHNLNHKAYATSSTHTLPSTFQSSPFCHTCSTNQLLLTNLLGSYLPEPSSPEYKARWRAYPEYKQSLHRRYPPVCANCAPAIEQEIQRKDQMARSSALGSWLKHSDRVKSKPPSVSTAKHSLSLRWWRIRGCLWLLSLIIALAANGMVSLGYQTSSWVAPPPVAILAITAISLLWTAWDPTYSFVGRSRQQGRHLRVRGKRQYIALQMSAWLSRMLTSFLYLFPRYIPSKHYFTFSFALELIVLLSCAATLRVSRPPQVRLLNTQKHASDTFREGSVLPDTTSPVYHTQEEDVLSGLSLPGKPVISTAVNPIFGVPSLSSSPSPLVKHPEDSDAMDWTPTDPRILRQRSPLSALNDDGDEPEEHVLRLQRFFAPEQPTGLENLLARTLLEDTSSTQSNHDRPWWKFGS